MHISLEFLKPTDWSFHGIVPGSAIYPLGRIALNVCFGNRQNYRREKLEFEVMDWPSQYHAILGRPAFSRFMALPHYTYLVLKMPVPNGIITVKGSFELSDLCDKEFHKMVQNFGMIANYREPKGKAPSVTAGVSTYDFVDISNTVIPTALGGSTTTLPLIMVVILRQQLAYLYNIDYGRDHATPDES
jgi:hypothetical protein